MSFFCFSMVLIEKILYLCQYQQKPLSYFIIMNKTFLPLVLSLLWGLLLIGCEGTPDGTTDDGGTLSGEVQLRTTRDILRANGEDFTTFTVLLTDRNGLMHDVTAQSEIYCEGNSEPLAEPKFSSQQAGEYLFYAVYGYATSQSDVVVKVTNGIGELPTDSAPESTDFHHRILLVQHTGTGCSQCPGMMSILKRISEDDAYNNRYNHVASHSYGLEPNYPDYAHSSAADELSRHLNVHYYPWVTFNLTEVTELDEESIKAQIVNLHKSTSDVGIAVAATCDDGVVYANIAIKAAKTGNYRMAVWLLEDGIFAKQNNKVDSWQDTHNNALRAMAGETKSERIYGKLIGTIEEGTTSEYIVAIDDLEDDWNVDYCEIMVVVTAADDNGNYDVVNTAVCKVGEKHAFEYNNQ